MISHQRIHFLMILRLGKVSNSMKSIEIKPLVYIFFLSFAFAAGFYIDGKNASVNNLSSDQWNILPVCIKLDHPDLYEGDLFADNINDIDYYTPFFISGVRFFTRFSDDNYIEGLNKLNFVINFLYTFLWALFLYQIIRNLPVTLLMTILIRGILWLPGYELWGAGALWTALPRTAFLALLPLPLLLLLPIIKNKYYHYAGGFILGLISNFHPISGIGMCFSLGMTYLLYHWFVTDEKKLHVLFRSIKVGAFMVLGLSPYIYIYFTEVMANKPDDSLLFKELLSLRIGEQFHQPLLALVKFTQLKWILFIMVPTLILGIIKRKLPEEMQKIFVFSLGLMLLTLSFSLLTVPVEQWIRKAGLDIHMSFQLIRNVKYVMLPVFVFYTLLIIFFIAQLEHRLQTVASWSLLSGFILVLLLARYDPVSRLPLIGDDFVRTTLPNAFSIRKEITSEDHDLDAMFEWVNANTDQNSKFISPPQLRTACRRSVVFDYKGAAMLIEGNPNKFVRWGKSVIELRKCVDIQCKIDLYKSWGADYLLIDEALIELQSQNRVGKWNLYLL